MKPSVGSIVHYVSHGTPGGEYGKECRAAVVTEVASEPGVVGLCVLNPTGQFFNRAVMHDEGAETPGRADCTDAGWHGKAHRYCACGWAEASLKGGTWHWPEHAGRTAAGTSPQHASDGTPAKVRPGNEPIEIRP